MYALFLLFFSLCIFIPFSGHTCTAFQVKAEDGSQVYGRSMEFELRLNSNLLIVPQGIEYTGTLSTGAPGLTWKTKYGLVGMNQNIEPRFVSDGMNEKGLVVAALYLAGYSEYQKEEAEKASSSLGAGELPTYLLSTCSTIKEVKEQIEKVRVVAQPIPALGNFVVPLHFYICDATGNTIVVEYIKGECHIYDNPLGVLTNSPPFPWHLANLGNYVNLSPDNISELPLSSWKVKNGSEGTGLLGLPGDYTPPSRFVRAALFSQWAQNKKSGIDAVGTCFHILDTFTIFDGIIRPDPAKKSSIPTSSITQWVVVHNMSEKKTYFKTYENQLIQMVDLKKIDFRKKDLQMIALSKQFAVEDASSTAVPLTQ